MFYECRKLTSLVIPDSVNIIGIRAFARCLGLESLYLPNTVTKIGNVAFEGCDRLGYCPSDVLSNLDAHGKYVVPSSWTNIQAFTFKGCTTMIAIRDSKYHQNDPIRGILWEQAKG